MKDRKKFAQASIMLAKLIAMAEEDERVNQLLEESGLFVEPEPENEEDEGGDEELDEIMKAMGEDKQKKEERIHTSDEIDQIFSAFGMDI